MHITVDFARLELVDENFPALLRLLPIHPRLQFSLLLEENYLTDESCDVLAKHPFLWLDFSKTCVSDAGVSALIKNPALRGLILLDCKLSSDQAEILRRKGLIEDNCLSADCASVKMQTKFEQKLEHIGGFSKEQRTLSREKFLTCVGRVITSLNEAIRADRRLVGRQPLFGSPSNMELLSLLSDWKAALLRIVRARYAHDDPRVLQEIAGSSYAMPRPLLR